MNTKVKSQMYKKWKVIEITGGGVPGLVGRDIYSRIFCKTQQITPSPPPLQPVDVHIYFDHQKN